MGLVVVNIGGNVCNKRGLEWERQKRAREGNWKREKRRDRRERWRVLAVCEWENFSILPQRVYPGLSKAFPSLMPVRSPLPAPACWENTPKHIKHQIAAPFALRSPDICTLPSLRCPQVIHNAVFWLWGSQMCPLSVMFSRLWLKVTCLPPGEFLKVTLGRISNQKVKM